MVGPAAEEISKVHVVLGPLNHGKGFALLSSGSGKSWQSFKQENNTIRFAF